MQSFYQSTLVENDYFLVTLYFSISPFKFFGHFSAISKSSIGAGAIGNDGAAGADRAAGVRCATTWLAGARRRCFRSA